MTDLQQCSKCHCNKLLDLFKIRGNTGMRYKTCIKCCERHKCDFDGCDYKCCSKSHLNRHIKGVHENLRNFECEFDGCDFKCSDKSNLNRHIKGVHENLKMFECEFDSCDFKCSVKCNLIQHIKAIHYKIKDFECKFDGCDFKCSQNNNLIQHIKRVHENLRNLECKLCDFKFSTQGHLNRHIKYNCHKGNPVPCSAGEKKVMEVLNKYDIDFIHDGNHNGLRSHEDKGYLRFDFIVKLDEEDFMMIEWDGRQHFNPVDCFKGEEGFERLQKNDKIKDDYCNDNKYNLLRLRFDCENVEESILELFAENGVDFF